MQHLKIAALISYLDKAAMNRRLGMNGFNLGSTD